MEIEIRELAARDKADWRNIDDSFTVDSILVPSLTGREFAFAVEPAPRYIKSYSEDFKEIEVN